MKYKIGDKVKVREDLIVGEYYNEEMFVKEMEKYCGKVLTISKIVPPRYAYRVKEVGWNWTNEMFEGLDKPEKFTSEVVFK